MNNEKLLERILEKENLNRAYKHVKRKGGAAGVDGMKVEELFGHFAEHKEEIIQKIRLRQYQPQPVLRVEIPKDNGGVRYWEYLQ